MTWKPKTCCPLRTGHSKGGANLLSRFTKDVGDAEADVGGLELRPLLTQTAGYVRPAPWPCDGQ